MFYENKFDSYESLDREINEYIKFYNSERIQVKFKGLMSIFNRRQASVSN
ncbi:MAG: IS3 family transposase [Acholeplasmataceae bacterium]|jgi:putative transposase|nr:IS3 family transposase [Acholeplasmataceae bacterium]